MSDTLKLETNRPVELAFRFTTGKECESQYSGPQRMYTVTLANGESKPLYLPVGAAQRVEEQLALQQIRAGEVVGLCKAEVRQGNRRGIEYQVRRVNPPEPLASPNSNGANGSQPPAPLAAVRMAAAAPTSDNNNAHSNAPNGNGAKTKLEDALCTVAAALLAAERYAKAIGYGAWPNQFTSEDVRTFANTMLINGSRENGHNGGGGPR